ncbi:MAG: hypothetical protein IJ242_16665 [Clostridia bacterium]|nr:hypothetical protein [Clostridia bacterium]
MPKINDILDLPDASKIIMIQGEDVFLEDGECIPRVLYQTALSLKRGYRVIDVIDPYDESTTKQAEADSLEHVLPMNNEEQNA